MIWIWSQVFDIPMIQIFVFYLDFEDAKNIHVLYVPIWGFGGCWRLLTEILHLDLGLEMVSGLWYNPDLNFGYLS